MARRRHSTIRVSPKSELAEALAQADATGTTVLVDTGETTYSIGVTASKPNGRRSQEGIWANYDPLEATAALDMAAGILSADRAEALIEHVYRARAEGSRPMHVRP